MQGRTATTETKPAPIGADDALSRQFPRRSRYLPILMREALARGLPPQIADAVVRIESGYDPSQIGSVGEIGLMQVRPATAAMLGFRGTDADLAVPETNLHYGVAYLAEAWRLAGGDLCRTLMKYRAGHGEKTMSPLSVEYCQRARTHLASLGWSPEPGSSAPAAPTPSPAPKVQPTRTAVVPRNSSASGGPKIVSVKDAPAFWAANRMRVAEAWTRISVMHRR
ncbi:lytic transglycosylase domain-containing protein [Methylobacterium nodulans]